MSRLHTRCVRALAARADGRLSIGNGPRAANSKLCFVEIYPLPTPIEPALLALPQIAGGQVTVTWTNGGTLYTAPAVNGPWTNTGDSDGSFTEPVAATKFYKVQR